MANASCWNGTLAAAKCRNCRADMYRCKQLKLEELRISLDRHCST
jgi:hypothetical protein